MQPQLSILFSIIFSSFCFFSDANQAAHDIGNRPNLTSEFDTYDEWKEFGFFKPANIVDRTRNVPLLSSLLGVPITANTDEMQPEGRTSLNTGSQPEHLQQSLEALFSEETENIVRSFRSMINSTVALGMALHDVFESASSDNIPLNAPFAPLLKKAATFIAITRDDFRARFPLPATAPGHAERAKHVSEALEHIQRFMIRLAGDYGIEQELIERHMTRVKPFLHDVGVLLGDVAELYPAAIEALVLNTSAVLLPEAVFLRSLVILYCFGPYVLGQDAISGWLLRHVSGVSSLTKSNA